MVCMPWKHCLRKDIARLGKSVFGAYRMKRSVAGIVRTSCARRVEAVTGPWFWRRRANGAIVSARKGSAVYTLTARGHAAHAGVEPEKGRNALIELAHQLLQFESLNGWREGLTINPGVITGGTLPNVVPDYAQIQFDVRYLHTQDRIALEERWRKMMQEQRVQGVALSLEVPTDGGEPIVLTPEALKLAQRAQEIAALLGFSVDHVITGGGSDGSFAAQYGVPVLDGLGPVGGLDHSPDEYLMANSVAPRTALLAGLIATIGAPTVFL